MFSFDFYNNQRVKGAYYFLFKVLGCLKRVLKLIIGLLICFLVVFDLMALALIIDKDTEKVVDLLFAKEILLPLAVLFAAAPLSKGMPQHKTLLGGLSLLYCCATYLLLYYNVEFIDNEMGAYWRFVDLYVASVFLGIMAEFNKLGLVIGFFNIFSPLMHLVVENNLGWIHKKGIFEEGKSDSE
ncbi:hypothetical protein [Modicisalibacter radicis]|uniref:hypothetical protein n=1 Tax=Halomonas sp. EAR18 TaxID=2518972 RepID=UPI00109C2F4E|nr:hypothetical protein [Halomonas sp. EAR18]